MQEDVLAEFLAILRRRTAASPDNPEQDRVESKYQIINSLLRDDESFQTCQLRQLLSGRLEADLGQAVDQAVASGSLEDEHEGCCRADAVAETLVQLVTSPTFCDVVGSSRSSLERTSGLLAISDSAGNVTSYGRLPGRGFGHNDEGASASPLAGGDVVAGEGRELYHTAKKKKKAPQREDWGNFFDELCAGADGGFSPRVDIEAALGQLEVALGNGEHAGAGAVKALDLLTGVSR